jgi:hypothetical protein
MEALPQARTTGQLVQLKSSDLEGALRAGSPAVTAAAEKDQAAPHVDLDTAAKLVQRTAAAMERIQEGLRKTENYATDFAPHTPKELVISDEKLATAEATIEALQGRLSGLENLLSAYTQLCSKEQEELRQAREWLIYLHEEIVER